MSTAGDTLATLAGITKQHYDNEELVVETYVKNPAWAKMLKEQKLGNVGGSAFVHPLIIGRGQGRSAAFAQAQNNAQLTGLVSKQFLVTQVQNFQLATVSTQAAYDTMGNENAFTDIITEEVDGCLENMGLDLSGSMYRSGDGVRGNLAASQNVALTVGTLSIASNGVNFEVGMELDAASSATGAVRGYGSAGHGLYVVKADEVNGTFTVGILPQPGAATCALNDAVNGIPTIAAGDFLFQRGDAANGTGVLNKMAGFEAWIPFGGPQAGDNFFGVDRTLNPLRLAGQSLDATTLQLEQALIQAATNVARQGGEINTFYMPFAQYALLQVSQSAKIRIQQRVTPEIGFEGLRYVMAGGEVDIIPDRSCPPDRVWGINTNAWRYTHVAKPIQIDNLDGNSWLRQSANSGYELRVFSIGQLVCRKPIDNVCIKVTPA